MLKAKKIVHITTVHPYPDVRIFYKECKSLAELGYQVTLITQADNDHVRDNVKIIALPKPKNRIMRMTKLFYMALKKGIKEKADIYHFHDPELIPLGIILKLFGKKVVYDIHESTPNTFLYKKYLPKPVRIVFFYGINSLEKISAWLFDALITTTAITAGRFPKHKTYVVENMPLKSEFYDNEYLPYKERPMSILYAGGITMQRGILQMLAAVSKLPTSLNARFNLAGRFESASLQQTADSSEGWRFVDYHGLLPREKLGKIFLNSRIGLVLFLPNKYHAISSPNKLFEYMAVGIPVLASDFPMWRDIIEKAQCGLLVDPLDPQAIAQAIQYLLENPEKAELMGINGKKAVEQYYSWETEKNVLYNVYEKLLA